jgi:hypothetical protein
LCRLCSPIADWWRCSFYNAAKGGRKVQTVEFYFGTAFVYTNCGAV